MTTSGTIGLGRRSRWTARHESEDARRAVSGEYLAIGKDPRVTAGAQLKPVETATTVRVQDAPTTCCPIASPRCSR